mmetsp:Transcript_20889/g.18517  ORF Transcript_20889/g.18517 Transcript_20889/m.18517 type:complete len:118 (-) Transcript_20889:202-555(-)
MSWNTDQNLPEGETRVKREVGEKKNSMPSLSNCKEDELINLNDVSNKISLDYHMQAFNQDLYNNQILHTLNMHNLKKEDGLFLQKGFNQFYTNKKVLKKFGLTSLGKHDPINPGALV